MSLRTHAFVILSMLAVHPYSPAKLSSAKPSERKWWICSRRALVYFKAETSCMHHELHSFIFSTTAAAQVLQLRCLSAHLPP
ncbi:hypothetical protein ACFX13_013642 [Malus domestica]